MAGNWKKGVHWDMLDFYEYLRRGQRLHENGRFSQAIHHYNQAISLKPEASIAYELRAVAHYDQKRYQAALQDFNQVIELNPFNDVAHWGRGKVFAAIGDHAWAIHGYSRAIELNGEEADYYQDRALALRQVGRLLEAKQDEARVAALTSL